MMKKIIVTMMAVYCHLLYSHQTWAQPMIALDKTSSITRVQVPNSSGGETFDFTLNLVDVTFANYTNFRFTWYFGDGEYVEYSEVFAQGASKVTQIRHTYHRPVDQTVYNDNDVYVEVTGGLYDDLDPPERASYGSHGPSGNVFETACSNCALNLNNGISSGLAITANRNMVSDHHVTFILSVANTCPVNEASPVNAQLDFSFDPDQMIPEDPTMPSIALLANSVSVNVSGQYSWMVNNLVAGEVRHIYVRMKLKPGLGLGSLIKADATLNYIGNTAKCLTSSLTLPYPGVVDNSHDPNLITSEMTDACPNARPDSMRYTIQFKNDGRGPADSVIIKTLIPEMYDLYSIEVVYPTYNSLVPTTDVDPVTREANWNLSDFFLKNNTLLKGSRQAGFGSVFFADATVDSLVFDVFYDENYIPRSCDAIINQAEIIFDCNPSITTGPYIYRFNCIDTIFDGATYITQCVTCDEVIDFSTPRALYSPSAGPVHLKYYNVGNIFSNTNNYRWFPSLGLTPNEFASQPFAAPEKSRDYFLVVQPLGECYRTIFNSPVDMDCQLEIVVSVQCNEFGQKQVFAEVLGDYTAGKLKWNNCDFVDIYKSNWLTTDQLYLTVTDVSNNCSTDLLVNLPSCSLGPNNNINQNGWTGMQLLMGLLLLFLGKQVSRKER